MSRSDGTTLDCEITILHITWPDGHQAIVETVLYCFLQPLSQRGLSILLVIGVLQPQYHTYFEIHNEYDVSLRVHISSDAFLRTIIVYNTISYRDYILGKKWHIRKRYHISINKIWNFKYKYNKEFYTIVSSFFSDAYRIGIGITTWFINGGVILFYIKGNCFIIGCKPVCI